jgi:hypothetical protein
MSHPLCYTRRMKNMKNKIKTYKVEFTTAFAGSPYVNIHLEAEDENQAKWVARNLCRFGYISNVKVGEEGDIALYTEETHDWAYDEDYEVYS